MINRTSASPASPLYKDTRLLLLAVFNYFCFSPPIDRRLLRSLSLYNSLALALSVGIGGCRPIDLLIIITVIVPLDRLLDIIGFVKVVDDDDSGEVEAAISVSVAAAPGGGQF